MTRRTKALIERAKAKAEHQERNAAKWGQSSASSSVVSPALIDEVLAGRWSTYSQIAEKFGLSWDKVAKDFRGRDGVSKFGSDYRVSDAAVRAWLTEGLMRAKQPTTDRGAKVLGSFALDHL